MPVRLGYQVQALPRSLSPIGIIAGPGTIIEMSNHRVPSDSTNSSDALSGSDVSRPVLYLDVDGVLNPFRATNPIKHWSDYHKEPVFLPDGRSFRVWFSNRLGQALQNLASRTDVEIVWATTWSEYVDELIAPSANLPLGLRRLPHHSDGDIDLANCGKLAEVSRDANDRPVIWIDDCLGPKDHAWAESRPAPTLAVVPDPAVGLRPRDILALESWLRGLTSISSQSRTR